MLQSQAGMIPIAKPVIAEIFEKMTIDIGLGKKSRKRYDAWYGFIYEKEYEFTMFFVLDRDVDKEKFYCWLYLH